MLTFAFMRLSLPCLPTFWHAIPTSFYVFKSCICKTNTGAVLGLQIKVAAEVTLRRLTKT